MMFREYQSPRSTSPWRVGTEDGAYFSATNKDEEGYRAYFLREGSIGLLTQESGTEPGFWQLAEHLFAENLDLTAIQHQGGTLLREVFLQQASLWVSAERGQVQAEVWAVTDSRAHPKRPALTPGIKYRKFFPTIGRTLSFRVVDLDRDLETLHNWHNQPRVADFWELAKSKEELRAYFAEGLAKAHQHPFILEVDGAPVGYFELYYTPEDRLGPYYEYDPFDRGFHFLIGSREHLGFANTDAIIKAVCHFLFLDDPRTRKIMAEPRSDNSRVLKYVEAFPLWRRVKEFDFPHKHAVLIEGKREKFFTGKTL
jgi:acetyl CoA:N6-hydroxylysine acetyl transferase